MTTKLLAGQPHTPQQSGFALIALLALLTVGVLYFLVGQLDVKTVQRKQDEVTTLALAQAKEALIAYAITYRDSHAGEVFGYLPCPDVNGDGSGDPANCGNAGETVVGLLPYKQLELPDLRDGSGACLWYAVSASFKASLTKPTPMNWDTQGTIRIQDVAGNVMAKPDDKNGGAAAVVFAPGPPLVGQNRSANAGSQCNVFPADYANYLDGIPSAGAPNIAYSFPSSTNPISVAAGTPDVVGAVNNDRLIWISAKEIFDRIKKRNDTRGFPTPGLLNQGITAIQSQLSGTPLSPPGTRSPLPIANPFSPSADPSDHNFYDNWREQFQYVTCATTDSYCYNVKGVLCDGVLLFGGADVSGNPRASTQRNVGNYFESAEAMALLTSTGYTFSGPNTYDGSSDASRAIDLGLCLRPKPLP